MGDFLAFNLLMKIAPPNREPSRPELSLSVFFPAYNEEGNVVESIFAAEKILRTITYRYEILIVDDGSTDRTARAVEHVMLFNPRVRLIQHANNMGYGSALWSGIQMARYEWVFFTDADLQFDLNELRDLVDYIPLYDVVIGYRSPRQDPFLRLVNAKGWNMLNRALFGLKVRDIDCAFKIFRKDIVASLPIVSHGAMVSAEILVRLSRMGVLFKEIPVRHLPRRRGSPTGAKPSVIWRAFTEMISLYRGDLGTTDSSFVQAIKFAAVGLANTAFDIVVYFLLTRYTAFFALHILSAKLLSFMAGTVSSFMLNRRFTFAIRQKINLGEVVRFYSTIGMALVINVLALYVLNNLLGIYDLIAVGISTIATFFWGFLFSKFWVFGGKKTEANFGRKMAGETV